MGPPALPAFDVGPRIDAVRRTLADRGLDDAGLLVTNPTNIRYLSGFSGSAGRLWVDAERVVLLTDPRYAERAANELAAVSYPGQLEVVPLSTDPAPVAALASGRAVAVEADHLTLGAHEQLAAAVDPVLSRGLVEAVRVVKEAAEVARIEAAAACADAALATVLDGDLVGRSEVDLAFSLEVEMRRAGAHGSGYAPIVASGPNAAVPHHGPGERIVGPGELVIIDVGAELDGYRSDMTRTYVVGDAPDELVVLLKVVTDLHERGVATVAPGVRAAAVDAACRHGAVEVGLLHEFLHATGHGVGLDIHEEPPVRPTSAATLQPGHVLTVEPGLYRAGTGGARVEDTLVVTAEGSRRLTVSPRQPFLAR